MTPSSFDVLVVGAGPAGACAARAAASQGVRVLVLEDHAQVGLPVQCGEGVNEAIFADTDVEPDPSFLRRRLLGMRMHFHTESYDLDSPRWRGFLVDRARFDAHLASLAEGHGARVRTSTRAVGMRRGADGWVVATTGEGGPSEIHARVVVGADGFSSATARLAGLRRRRATDEYMVVVEREAERLELEADDRFHFLLHEAWPEGYGFVFPMGRARANVGVCGRPGTDAELLWASFIAEARRLRLLGPAAVFGRVKSGAVPRWTSPPIARLAGDAVLLAGDAGGFVDPVTLEGVAPAMLSGLAAGRAAAEWLRLGEGTLVEAYARCLAETRWMGRPLLEDLSAQAAGREEFYRAFPDPALPASVREEIIRLLDAG